MSKPTEINLKNEFLQEVRATQKSVGLLKKCRQNRHGPYIFEDYLEKILQGEYRCFQVVYDPGLEWECTIYYQGRDLDRVLEEFTAHNGSSLKCSLDGKTWKSVGGWVRNNGERGDAFEHAYGRMGARLANEH